MSEAKMHRLKTVWRGFVIGLATPLGLIRCAAGKHQGNARDWGDPDCVFCGKEIR